MWHALTWPRLVLLLAILALGSLLRSSLPDWPVHMVTEPVAWNPNGQDQLGAITATRDERSGFTPLESGYVHESSQTPCDDADWPRAEIIEALGNGTSVPALIPARLPWCHTVGAILAMDASSYELRMYPALQPVLLIGRQDNDLDLRSVGIYTLHTPLRLSGSSHGRDWQQRPQSPVDPTAVKLSHGLIGEVFPDRTSSGTVRVRLSFDASSLDSSDAETSGSQETAVRMAGKTARDIAQFGPPRSSAVSGWGEERIHPSDAFLLWEEDGVQYLVVAQGNLTVANKIARLLEPVGP
jgi:hypothetical protein